MKQPSICGVQRLYWKGLHTYKDLQDLQWTVSTQNREAAWECTYAALSYTLYREEFGIIIIIIIIRTMRLPTPNYLLSPIKRKQ